MGSDACSAAGIVYTHDELITLRNVSLLHGGKFTMLPVWSQTVFEAKEI